MGTIAQFEEEEWSISLTELGWLAIAIGTPVARCPPHRPGRALILGQFHREPANSTSGSIAERAGRG